MASNAGMSSEVCLLEVQSMSVDEGLDFSSGERVNLIQSGIIDPTKVTRCALKNAVSVAGTLLLTNHSIVHT